MWCIPCVFCRTSIKKKNDLKHRVPFSSWTATKRGKVALEEIEFGDNVECWGFKIGSAHNRHQGHLISKLFVENKTMNVACCFESSKTMACWHRNRAHIIWLLDDRTWHHCHALITSWIERKKYTTLALTCLFSRSKSVRLRSLPCPF